MGKIIYTYGVFDILHIGHIKLLQRAKKLGDYLIVGIVMDKAVQEKKGNTRPIQNHYDRLKIIKSLKFVDEVYLQTNFDPSENLIKLYNSGKKIKILCKGNDWRYIPGQETIRKLKGKLIKLPYSKKYSTTKIINKIKIIK